MTYACLIHAIVRQTMVLIAQLATSHGHRYRLADIANQTFVRLCEELTTQGLKRQVIADMFGMTLRSYHAKMQRLRQSATFRQQTLWSAVATCLQKHGKSTRHALFKRFTHDEASAVVSVLNDLVTSGLVDKTGRGDTATYRLIESDETAEATTATSEDLESVIMMMLYTRGPLSVDELATHLPNIPSRHLQVVVEQLVASGEVKAAKCESGVSRYSSSSYLIALDTGEGWEAAVLDHFQAVATAIAAKVKQRHPKALRHDVLGGATYHFDIGEQHPFREEVLSLLCELRTRVSTLRQRVEDHNRASGWDSHDGYRVTCYVGQMVTDDTTDAVE